MATLTIIAAVGAAGYANFSGFSKVESANNNYEASHSPIHILDSYCIVADL